MGSQITSKDLTYEFFKKLSKTFISFSIFTFFLSNPSWLCLFLQSFISHISSFPSQFLSHINDKNWIFLLFNGILAIILKKSSSSRKKNEIFESLQPSEQVTSTNQMQPAFEAVLENVELSERESEDEENELLVDSKNCIEAAKDQGEEESVARMSTEELNRKFEDFIRRMKEEIRIEAHQQLV